MHGRLKVKTTAEQQEEKRKERQKKLKIFERALDIAFKKISAKNYDAEGMEISKQILAANSDYATLWNYRKNAFMFFKNNKTNEEFDACLKDELALIESCLRNNPKSYGCWHHRCFVMLKMNEPDWKRELHLCDLFHQFDDRNFHCWDYRRFVLGNTDQPLDNEISYTNSLIENNFSNYSSWHYRSKLLPQVYPDEEDSSRIAEKMLLEELELVQNAFFTDPNDQSAWFYHRWLLGRGETTQDIISLHVTKAPVKMTCTLRKPIKLEQCNAATVTVNDKVQEGTWHPSSPDKYAHSWTFTPTKKQDVTFVKLSCQIDGVEAQCTVSGLHHEAVYTSEISPATFRACATENKLALLEDQLNSCQELNDLEPGNKWIVLTLALLMGAIDIRKHFDKVLDLLNSLCEIDSKRSCYYKDLRSRYEVENTIVYEDMSSRGADFSGRSLTRLCHTEFLATLTVLDISNNQLTCLGGAFSQLQCLKILKANVNQITHIEGLSGLPSLLEVELRSNEISSMESLDCLTTCKSLQMIHLKDNPLKVVIFNEVTKNYKFDVDLPFAD